MNLCLEFTMTAADLREVTARPSWSWFSLIRHLVAIFMASLGAWRWFTSGLDWLVALYVALSVYFCFSEWIFISLFVPLMQFSTKHGWLSRVSIDEQAISIEQSKHQRTIPWSSFAMTGTAREIENHFLLECGRGAAWIPKRAFATAEDMAAFRALVKEKMGERCQFTESLAPRG
jgi:hypothetical protein